MITLTQLEYIIAVDNYRHFATAAEKCFVTQPTLSMQIKKLEEFLGVTIFDRSKQPIIPTDLGTKIIAQARNVLKETQEIDEIIRSDKNDLSGSLRIGIIPTLSPYLLPLFIGQFTKEFPEIDITIEELFTYEIESKLKKDELDIGILVTPLKDTEIEETPIFYEEMMVYCDKKNNFLTNDEFSLSDINTPDLWLLNDGHCFRSQVINLCKMKQGANNHPFKFDGGSLETIIKIIDQEGGFTLIPELAGLDLIKKKSDQVLCFSDYTPLREVAIVYTRHYTKRKIIDLVAKKITAAIPKRMREKERGTIVEWR
ncbi:LysR substrate-binding domain-containing protein [Prolixibacteraceae bacterium]|nr:LysR substrate-binding domain-containing protein [Prolixibacteraceae bacterium]